MWIYVDIYVYILFSVCVALQRFARQRSLCNCTCADPYQICFTEVSADLNARRSTPSHTFTVFSVQTVNCNLPIAWNHGNIQHSKCNGYRTGLWSNDAVPCRAPEESHFAMCLLSADM